MEYRIQRTEDYLAHHGVLGQKWGIRRYQNEDGSYKPGAEGRYDPAPSGTRQKVRNAAHKITGKASEIIAKKKKRSQEKYAQEKSEWDEMKKKLSDRKAAKKAEKEKRRAAAAERKAANKAKRAEIRKAQEEYAEQRHLQRQADRDKKASTDSYKKIALRALGRHAVTVGAGSLIGLGVARKTGDMGLGVRVAKGIGDVGGAYNGYKTINDAYRLADYRRRKGAKHSDISGYDELYHSESGNVYGIVRDGSIH